LLCFSFRDHAGAIQDNTNTSSIKDPRPTEAQLIYKTV